MSFSYPIGACPKRQAMACHTKLCLGDCLCHLVLIMSSLILYFISFDQHYKCQQISHLYYLLHREDQEVSYGLNLAIAGRGVIVKDKVFHNLETSELQKAGATYLGICNFLLSCCDV